MIDLSTFQLREGMEGPVVMASQDLLEGAGFSLTEDGLGQVLEADGIYGPNQTAVTKRAQAKLQEEGLYHSTIDGDFGPATLTALLDKTGKTLADFEEMIENDKVDWEAMHPEDAPEDDGYDDDDDDLDEAEEFDEDDEFGADLDFDDEDDDEFEEDEEEGPELGD